MAKQIFIDGEAGTTGLQLKNCLAKHPHITLISLPHSKRKDISARLAALAEADMAVLCLPDAAAHEIVAAADKAGITTPMLDASTAHRCHADWVYGFPELTKDDSQRHAIANSNRIANTGCYAVGMIALLRPLLEAGLLARDAQLAFTAISGYSGGGKTLIGYMEAGSTPRHFAYALTHTHKHIPEVMAHSGLTHAPLFTPMVGDFYQGMLVILALPVTDSDASAMQAALATHYAGEAFIRVHANDTGGLTEQGYLGMEDMVGTNFLDVHAFHGTNGLTLIGRLDNLGKGAATAAVQNINIALGLDEAAGLA